MTIKQIYKLAIDLGVKNDLRGVVSVKKYLERAKKKYDKLSEEEKEEFDTEKLINPYSDARILHESTRLRQGSGEAKKVKKILAGIDMEVGELLLADKMGDIDLVFAHHPEGGSLC